jgi:uncharacterized alkaline shock family protein YloU
MNIFNRIIMILILIATAIFSIVAMVNEFIGFFKWSNLMLIVFNPEADIPIYISVLALLFILVISVFLLMLEFYKARRRTAAVSSIKGGKAMITLESIANQITDHVIEIEAISEVKVNITPKSNAVIINVFTNICDCEDIPEKMREIIKVSNDVATRKLGLKVLKTNVTVTNITKSTASKTLEEEPGLLIGEDNKEQ